MFSFPDCRFSIHKSKESTARVALWREYKIPNIFTLEASFYGYDVKEGKTVPYTITDFMNIGRSLCKSIYVYMTHIKGLHMISELPFQSGAIQQNDGKFAEDKETPEEQNKKVVLNTKNLIAELKNDAALLKYGDLSDDSGSDSDPSDDELPNEHLIKILPKSMRAKVMKKIVEEEKAKPTKKLEIVPTKSAPNQIKAARVQIKSSEEIVELSKKTPRVQVSTQVRATFKLRSKTEIKTRPNQDRETQTEEFIFDVLLKIEKDPNQKFNASLVTTFSFEGEQFLVVSPSKTHQLLFLNNDFSYFS